MIDIHAHFQPMVDVDWWPIRTPSADTMVYRGRVSKVHPGLTSLEIQADIMKELGIRQRAICVSPMCLGYDLSPEEGIRYCRAANDKMAEDIARFPGQFVGLAALPMQSPADVPKELERCVRQLGFKGAFIGSNVLGTELDNPVYFPFWEKVCELDAAVLIQATNFAGADRLKDYYFGNMIGNRFEILLCACRMIFSGLLDRFPTAKIILGQGGGYVAFAAGRMDHAWKTEADARKVIQVPPSTYIPRFYFDTLLHSERELNYLVSLVGAERVALGTDAPYAMGDPDPNKTVKQWIKDDGVLRKILVDTPKSILGL